MADKLTVVQLKKFLKDNDIKFKSNDKKDVLVNLFNINNLADQLSDLDLETKPKGKPTSSTKTTTKTNTDGSDGDKQTTKKGRPRKNDSTSPDVKKSVRAPKNPWWVFDVKLDKVKNVSVEILAKCPSEEEAEKKMEEIAQMIGDSEEADIYDYEHSITAAKQPSIEHKFVNLIYNDLEFDKFEFSTTKGASMAVDMTKKRSSPQSKGGDAGGASKAKKSGEKPKLLLDVRREMDNGVLASCRVLVLGKGSTEELETIRTKWAKNGDKYMHDWNILDIPPRNKYIHVYFATAEGGNFDRFELSSKKKPDGNWLTKFDVDELNLSITIDGNVDFLSKDKTTLCQVLTFEDEDIVALESEDDTELVPDSDDDPDSDDE